MNQSESQQQATSQTLGAIGSNIIVDNQILRASDLNTNFSKGFSTSFKPVSPLNAMNSCGNVIKPVALKRSSSQVSTPLAGGISNFSSFSSLAVPQKKSSNISNNSSIGGASDMDKENISNATFSLFSSKFQQQLGQVQDMMANSSNNTFNNNNSNSNQDMLMQAHSLAQVLLEQSKNSSFQQQQQEQQQQQQQLQQQSKSLEDTFMRELQLQLELASQQQQTPLSNSSLMNKMSSLEQATPFSQSSPFQQFLSQEGISTELNLLNQSLGLSSIQANKIVKSTPVLEGYEEATSPFLTKKRKVQKGGATQKLSQKQLTEPREGEQDSQNQEQGQQSQSSSQSLQSGQIEEVKIINIQQNIENKKGKRRGKGKKALSQENEKDDDNKSKKASQKDLDEGNTLSEPEEKNVLVNTLQTEEIQQQQQQEEDIQERKEMEVEEQEQDNDDDNNNNNEDSSDKSQKLSNNSAETECKKQTTEQQIAEDNGSEKKTRVCNCKKTKCIKLYCDCFAAGEFCGGDCNCCDCANTHAHKEQRDKIVEGIIGKNPFAFNLKEIEPEEISQLSMKAQKKLASKKGCNCRRSGCLKKYCQCYQDGLQCGEHCKCNGCENCEKPAKKLFIAEQSSISLQSQGSNSIASPSISIGMGQSQLVNSQLIPSLSQHNSNNLSFNEIQSKQHKGGSPQFNQQNTQQKQQQNINQKVNKSNNITTNNQIGFNFNQDNTNFTNNNSFNMIDENTQQLMLTHLLSNMVAQQNSILNNPLIQLATLQASLQQTFIQSQQQQQQQQQNSFDNSGFSLESFILQAAAAAASSNNNNNNNNSSFKDIARLSKQK